MTNGTVQTITPAPLTAGETWDFAAALMQQAPRDLDPSKVRHYLANKRELGADLRSVLGQPLPAFDTSVWQKFFKKYFGRTFDLSNLHIPAKPAYLCWAIVVPQGLTSNDVFDACTKVFNGKTWRYESDLNTIRDIVKLPDSPYVVWVSAVVEADEKLKNKSAEDIEKEGINTLTLKERMMLELVYFDETGNHLDINNWTLCAGSRDSDGDVPVCRWSDDGFYVYWYGPGSACPGLRSRVAVS